MCQDLHLFNTALAENRYEQLHHIRCLSAVPTHRRRRKKQAFKMQCKDWLNRRLSRKRYETRQPRKRNLCHQRSDKHNCKLEHQSINKYGIPAIQASPQTPTRTRDKSKETSKMHIEKTTASKSSTLTGGTSV